MKSRKLHDGLQPEAVRMIKDQSFSYDRAPEGLSVQASSATVDGGRMLGERLGPL